MTVSSETIIFPLKVKINVLNKDGKPALEIRKLILNQKYIKQIVSSIYHNKPIIIEPTVTDKMQFINRLLETGIVYKDKDTDEYNYTLE